MTNNKAAKYRTTGAAASVLSLIPDDRRVFLLAAAGVAAHQLQSWVADPGERNFRATYLALTGLAALSALFPERLPRQVRGAIAVAVGAPPLGGAAGAHLLPILRGRAAPPASETAILNLGGAAFLVAFGVSLLRTPPRGLGSAATPGPEGG